MTSPKSAARSGSTLWIAGLVVVIVLGVIAVVVARGSNDGADVSEAVAAAQVRPVTVDEGSADPLATFPGNGEADPAIGATLPTISGTTLDGDPLTIGPDGGAKVVLFVAHWCPHCQAEVPRIVEHLAESPMPDDVELVTVSTGVEPGGSQYPPSAWLEDEGWDAPVLADSEEQAAAAAFGLRFFPYFIAVDAEGTVVQRTTGEISMEQFDQLVEAAQSGTAA